MIAGRRNCVRFFRDRPSPPTEAPVDYFRVLGISRREYPSLTAQKVKKLYLKKAMKLHPDVNAHLSESASVAAFQKLSEAYQVLRCDEKRKAHAAQLDKQEIAEEDIFTGTNYQESADYGTDSSWAVELPRTPMVQKMKKEYKAALSRAYWGPHFEVEGRESSPAAEVWPDAFETEERVSPKHSNRVLDILSGRQLLGWVAESSAPKALDLHWMDGITATALLSSSDQSETLIYMRRAQMYLDPLHSLHLWSTEASLEERMQGAYLVARVKEGGDVSCGSCGRQTHAIFRYRSPGVQFCRMYDVESKRLDFAASRCVLPPTQFWHWDPRCESHTGGSYFERSTKRDSLRKPHQLLAGAETDSLSHCKVCSRHHQYGAALDPSIYLLSMAHEHMRQEDANK
jgi:curved DNA-binding protein CbpA